MLSPLTTLIALNTLRSKTPAAGRGLAEDTVFGNGRRRIERDRRRAGQDVGAGLRVPVARVLSGFSAVVDSVTSAVSEVASAVVPVPQPCI